MKCFSINHTYVGKCGCQSPSKKWINKICREGMCGEAATLIKCSHNWLFLNPPSWSLHCWVFIATALTAERARGAWKSSMRWGRMRNTHPFLWRVALFIGISILKCNFFLQWNNNPEINQIKWKGLKTKKIVLGVNFLFINIYWSTGTSTTPNVGQREREKSEVWCLLKVKCFLPGSNQRKSQ